MITYNMIKPRLIARVSMETDHGPEVLIALEKAQTYREAVSVARRYRRRRPSLFVRLLEWVIG